MNRQIKAAFLTGMIICLSLFFMYSFGMRYFDPPKEYGITINFGTSDLGGGSSSTREVKESENKSDGELEESVLTANDKDALSVSKKEVKKEILKPSKATQNALSNLLEGDGPDTESGLKGKESATPSRSKYYDNIGNIGGENYNLSGRKPLIRPIIKPNCNEEGLVVVSIEVDNSGKVIKAVAGVKGSTNTAPCLLNPAKKAALLTTWNPDKSAPAKQVGLIIYHFTLSQ